MPEGQTIGFEFLIEIDESKIEIQGELKKMMRVELKMR